jgi:hypothetical protein
MDYTLKIVPSRFFLQLVEGTSGTQILAAEMHVLGPCLVMHPRREI